MASKGWQHPYVNVFKHVKVEEWRKSAKEGDVSTCTDRTLKCPVFRIRGPVPANSYVLVPRTSSQSLGLTGRFFYLLFRPTPGKYFVVHLDVAAEEGVVVRVSFSNMFKEFKSTATWLQFPFLCGAAKDSVYDQTSKAARRGLVGPAPPSVRWTCLTLDLQLILSVYAGRRHRHLSGVRLCANMSVKNVFTTDLLLNPGMSFSEAKLMGLASSLGTGPIPREMSFPVPKGSSWHDLYDHIRFPSEGTKAPFDSIQKASSQQGAHVPAGEQPGRVGRSVREGQEVTTPMKLPWSPAAVAADIPELGVVSADQQGRRGDESASSASSASSGSRRCSPVPPGGGHDGAVHVFVHREGAASKPVEELQEESVRSLLPPPVSMTTTKANKQQKLLPDPILRLKRIIGFGGGTMKCALWTRDGDAVVYPCHAIIVCMEISSNQQRFFIGHTEKVSSMAFNGDTTLLASAQTGVGGVVRVWDYHGGNCLTVFAAHAHFLSCLSFSYGGGILCGVGRDRHDKKTVVLVWNTLSVRNGGLVTVVAKANTDVDINTMKVTSFDDTRMVSCGRDNIRLWRLRNGTLRSCPVGLGERHPLDFTDVAFQEGNSPERDADERTLFASTRSGHVFEIDYGTVAVKNVRRLFPERQQDADRREKWTFNTGPGIAINSLSVSPSFCATGSEDGFLRLWPLDFSAVFLQAEHEGPVSAASISVDGLRVLSATSTGNLGFLDVSSRGYSTLMRSHTDAVLGFSVDGVRPNLTTASSDGTVRIWNVESLHQLYDFASEDSPCSVAFHPSQQIFSCGFSSGVVRVFDISSAKLLAEHKQLQGEVVGLTFSPDEQFMYGADSLGSLALYDASEEDFNVVRVVCNVVAPGTECAPDALAVSGDSRRLAFVGPSEYVVTVADARTLDELLHVDVSVLDTGSARLDSALKVRFPPASAEHLLVATSANKILWVSTETGRLLREVSKVHKRQCSSLAVSDDGRFLLTAGHNAVKVWDYNMQLDLNSQMFIGHSQPIRQIGFTPDQRGVVSVGDAIFLWDFLGRPIEFLTDNRSSLEQSHISTRSSSFPCHARPTPTKNRLTIPTDTEENGVHLCAATPRRKAPLPSSPPPRLVGQGAVGGASMLSDDISPFTTFAGPPSEPGAAVSFLRVTDLVNASPPNPERVDSGGPKRQTPVRPDCYRHFIPRFKNSSADQAAVAPQPQEQGLKLKAVIGYNGNGRGNMAWSPDQGLFAYSCGSMVVVECLHTGRQRHLRGHTEEVSCLAVTNDAQTVSSAAGGGGDGNKSLIYIWDIQSATSRNTIAYHRGAVQCLAFSRDDRFLLSIGDFTEPDVALWSSQTFQLLSSVKLSGPIHDAAFSPTAAGQLACVGGAGVYFCLVQSRGRDVDLKVQRAAPPPQVGEVEVTAVCYHSDSVLFTGTNRGHVCAWDVATRRCFMTWEADEGEIGVLLCRGNRLLTGSNTRWLRLWEAGAAAPRGNDRTGELGGTLVKLEQELMLDGATVGAAFDHTMDMGIVGTTAGTLWYVSWSDRSNTRLVSGHKTQVNDVVFSPDESHFSTCSEDGSVRVWSTSGYELVVQFQVLSQACGCVCWSPASGPEDSLVAAGYSDGTLRVFRLSSREMELKLHPHQVALTAIQYSVHGHVILSAGENGLVVVSSAASGATVRVIRDHRGATVATIQCVSRQCGDFGLAGNEVWLAAGADRRVSVWAADWSRLECDLLDWLSFPAPPHPPAGGGRPPSLAAFCPDDPGLLVYTGYGVERELSFYSLAEKRILRKVSLPHWASCFSLSSGSRLVAVGSQADRVLKLIQSTSGRFQDFLHHSDSLQTCRFSPSGRLLFSVAFNEILLWEVQGL